MLPNSTRRISIAWFRQNSGAYALKGITIEENGHSYDSSATFRDGDAEWLTRATGAEAEVEFHGYRSFSENHNDYPVWARDTEPAVLRQRDESLEVERAGASLLRLQLEQLIEACSTETAPPGLAKYISEAKDALAASDAGTHYPAPRAKAVLAAARKRK